MAPNSQNVEMLDLDSTVPPDLPGPEKKRLRLLEAAAERFATLGFAKTAVEEIARAAGVSKGLLYVHYRSKEELFAAVLQRTLDQWGESIAPSVDGEATVRGALQTMHRTSIGFAGAHPLLRRIFAQDALLVRSLVEDIAEASLRDWIEELTALFERGRANGELRPDLDVAMATKSYYLLHLSFLDRLTEQDVLEILSPEVVDGAMAFLLDGMKCSDA